jgi:pimeloyl-ACP methyl ester carboxylesterase
MPSAGCRARRAAVDLASTLEPFLWYEASSQDSVEIKEYRAIFTKDFRYKQRDQVEEFFKVAWATHAKLDPFIHLCIARHNFEGTHRLGDVQAPTLVLIGEADTVGSNHRAQAKVLVERIAGAEMKVLKGQSHGFFWQATEQTNAVILDWVKRHSGG